MVEAGRPAGRVAVAGLAQHEAVVHPRRVGEEGVVRLVVAGALVDVQPEGGRVEVGHPVQVDDVEADVSEAHRGEGQGR